MFRNENETVLRKVHKNTAAPENRHVKNSHESSSPATAPAASPSDIPTVWELSEWNLGSKTLLAHRASRQLSPDFFEDKGISFFFAHYVMILSTSTGEAVHYRATPFWPQLWTNKLFFNAVCSVGLAALSNVTKDQVMMVKARQRYLELVGYVAKALKNLDEVDLEDILKAVTMLAIFEVVNSRSGDTSIWGVHIDGAANLLRLIKTKSIMNQSGYRMHLQICFAVFVRYFQSGTSLPPELLQWAQDCQKTHATSDLPAYILVGVVSRFIDLHASIRSGDLADPETIVQKLLECEGQLTEWEAQLPESWKYTIVKATGTEENVYRGQYQVYRDLWSCRIWNHYRWTRILVNELILTHLVKLSPFPPEFAGRQNIAERMILKTATDICDSVAAQFFRRHMPQANALFVPYMSGVVLLLFPLAVAGGSIGVPEDLHIWVIKLLEKIGNTMGIQQALTLVTMTKKHWKRIELEIPFSGEMEFE